MSNITRRKDQGLGKTARGGSSGSFASHERDASAPPPASTGQPAAEQLMSPGFTQDAVSAHWPDVDVIPFRPLAGSDGLYESRVIPTGDYPREHSVIVNEDGDVVRVEEFFPAANGNQGAWFESDSEKDRLQARVRTQRLAAMGVIAEGSPNDGGYTGFRFTGSKNGDFQGCPDAAQVSKLVRKDVKRAIELGALPSDVDVRVRTHKYSGGQAVNIDVKMPKGTAFAKVPRGQMSAADRAYWEQEMRGRPSVERQNISDSLRAIGNQWNDVDNDSMTDYYSSSYHLSVQISEGEHERIQAAGRS